MNRTITKTLLLIIYLHFIACKWTVLVYMIGDNNLEPFAVQDLKEMATVGSGTNLNVIVRVDMSGDYYNKAILNLPNFRTAKDIKVNRNSLQVLKDLSEINMINGAYITDFIKTYIPLYPADNYAIVFWDHGAGWIGYGEDEHQKRAAGILTMDVIKSAITAGLQGTGVSKFSMMGFDACLMATLEVMSNFDTITDTFISSVELEPGIGWDYSALSTVTSTISPLTLSTNIVNYFYSKSSNQGATPLTLGVYNLSNVQALRSSMFALANSIKSDIAPSALKAAYNSYVAPKGDPNMQLYSLTDIGDFVDQLALQTTDSAVKSAITSVKAALSKVVLYHRTDRNAKRAQGISIYLPVSTTYYDKNYRLLNPLFVQWDNWIVNTLLAKKTISGSLPNYISANMIRNDAHGSYDITATLNAGSGSVVSDGGFDFGVSNYFPGINLLLKFDYPDIENDKVFATVTNDVYFIDSYLVSSGASQKKLLAYAFEDEDVYTIPFYYYSRGSTRRAILYFMKDDLNTYMSYVIGNTATSELVLNAGDILYPVLFTENATSRAVKEYVDSNVFISISDTTDLRLTTVDVKDFIKTNPNWDVYGTLYWHDINNNLYGFQSVINQNGQSETGGVTNINTDLTSSSVNLNIWWAFGAMIMFYLI